MISKKAGSTSQEKTVKTELKKDSKAINSTEVVQAFTSAVTMQSKNPPCLQVYQDQMRGFYKIQNGENHFIDFSGYYPKMRFTAGANSQEIREAYDFGMLGEVYLSAPEFNELTSLPKWIKNGVKNNFENNPTISVKDILRLNCFSAGPNFDQ